MTTVICSLIGALVIACFIFGCAHQSVDEKQKKVEVQHQQVVQAANTVDAETEKAKASNETALIIVNAAATRPTTPPDTRTELTIASGHMEVTQTHLNNIAPQTRGIRTGSENLAETAKGAIKGEDDAKKDLTKERDHWLGYKSRVLLWSVLGGFIVIVIIAAVLQVAGGGAIITMIGSAIESFLELCGPVLEGIFTWSFHTITLGSAWIGTKIGTLIKEYTTAKPVISIVGKPTAPVVAANETPTK